MGALSPVTLKVAGRVILTVLRFQQIKAFSQHTTAVVDLPYDQSRAGLGSTRPWVAPEWSPAEVYLGGTTWYGYVHHGGVVTDSQDPAGSVIRYTLIGTSLPMNEQRTRSWKNVTATSIVRQISREHRLRTVVTPHKAVMPYYAQTGVSDWKVLQQMADQTGYRLWVDGATTTFVDPALLLEGVRAATIPSFSQNRIVGLRDNLFSFTSKVGTMVPRPAGATSRVAQFGLDDRSGRVLQATGSTDLGFGSPLGGVPLLTQIGSGRVGSLGEASSTVGAAVANTSAWVTATAVVKGAANVVPGMVVNISGGAIPKDQTGRWVVSSVEHRVLNDLSKRADSFTSTLLLERNRFYGTNITSAVRVNNNRDTVPATMRNGYYWEADYLESINVA